MFIKDMFKKPIDREFEGVVVAGDEKDSDLKQELEEYVVTKELNEHFKDLFSAYKKGIDGTTPKMGVWISGFFGSGKSHFLKMISFLMANKVVDNKTALEYFREDKKITDKNIMADIEQAAGVPTDVILFNISAKSHTNAQGEQDSLTNVFLRVFNEMQGFYAANPAMADLERYLADNDKFNEFKEKIAIESQGTPWETVRTRLFYSKKIINTVLSQMGIMEEKDFQTTWDNIVKKSYDISIEDFAKYVKSYINRKGNNHHIVFCVDEVGQYIGADSKLMLELQTITEELGKECEGKAWVIVTSQQDIDSVTKVKGNDFSKIQGRFATRLALSSTNADVVIKKRILEKNEVAAKTLQVIYEQKETVIKNVLTFTNTTQQKLYSNKKDFEEVYPFVPYQFNLLAKVLTAIRQHGASGKHLSEGERSMLAMFKESAMMYMNSTDGLLMPFCSFYDAMQNFLDHTHRSVISKAGEVAEFYKEGKEQGDFTVNVLKVLFLIKYVEGIPANVDNIATLMTDNIDTDRVVLKKRVEASLKMLAKELLIQQNGSIYIFLTNEEQEINRLIAQQVVEPLSVTKKTAEIIFDDIFAINKFLYNNRYGFAFNQLVDDYDHKPTAAAEIGVLILTPAADYDIKDEVSMRTLSQQKQAVVFVLNDEYPFFEEITNFLKIEDFLRMGNSNALVKYEDIKTAKTRELTERKNRAVAYLREALKKATIYVNEDIVNISSKEPAERLKAGMEQLVKSIYHKLFYIDNPDVCADSEIRTMLNSSSSQNIKLFNGKEPNENALQDMLQYVENNTQHHTKLSIKTIKEHFKSAPYGFLEEEIHYLVARLFKRGELCFSVSGQVTTLQNTDADTIADYIIKKSHLEKLMIEKRNKVNDRAKKTVRKIIKELFGMTLVDDDEDDLMAKFKECSQKLEKEILAKIQPKYETASYPGKQTIDAGLKLLEEIEDISVAQVFFDRIGNKEGELLDFADDYAPVKNFFAGEQKKIFDNALKTKGIFEKSENFISDEHIADIIKQIRDILVMEKPYPYIKDLPDLIDEFNNSFVILLEDAAKPVKEQILEAQKRVFEELDTKTYQAEFAKEFEKRFATLLDKIDKVDDIATVHSCEGECEALKMACLGKMTNRDNQIAEEEARKRAAEAKKEQAASATDKGETPAQPPTPAPRIIKRKNISVRSLFGAATRQIKNEEDVNKLMGDIKTKLLSELQEDTIINLEL